MKYFFINAPNFNLIHTFECGQAFRWERVGNTEYQGVIRRSIIRVKQENDRLFVSASTSEITPSFIKSYFDLDIDLAYIYNKIGKDKAIKRAIKRFYGLRIIRQPLWECLASFIISAYNNIPRIKGIIYNLSICSGERLVLGEKINYSFPNPRIIANSSLGQLRICGAGFRAPYLKKAARAFWDGSVNVDMLKKAPYGEAKEALMRLDGVGEKVADCVLLYSVGRFEAFPVDVWIKRVMEKLYFNGAKASENKIREFAGKYFGEYAGYAQQYLYHYARTALKL